MKGVDGGLGHLSHDEVGHRSLPAPRAVGPKVLPRGAVPPAAWRKTGPLQRIKLPLEQDAAGGTTHCLLPTLHSLAVARARPSNQNLLGGARREDYFTGHKYNPAVLTTRVD